MKKHILIIGLACVLAFNVAACGKKSKSADKESTTESNTKETETNTETKKTESTTEFDYSSLPALADDNALTFYNATDGSECGIHIDYGNTKEAILNVLDSIKNESNLVEKYSANDESKTFIPFLRLRADDSYISYIGEDKWAFETENEISIYQAKGDNATLPLAYLATCVAVPFGFAESHYYEYAGKYQEEYVSFFTIDKDAILNNLDIDISNISDKSVAISPDFDTALENIFVYKNENKYIRYISTKELTGKTAGDCYIERSDMDCSNKSPEIEYAYSFFRYKNKAFGRDGQKTKWYAIDKRDDDIIINEKNFHEQLKNDYSFLYGFPVKLQDISLTLEVYKYNDTYIGVLLEENKNPFKAWFINKDGFTIATDIIYEEPDIGYDAVKKKSQDIKSFFEDCYNEIYPDHLSKRPERKEPEKKEYEPTEYATDFDKDLAGEEYTLGQKAEKTEVVETLLKVLNDGSAITLNCTTICDSDEADISEIHSINTTDGNCTYSSTYATPDKVRINSITKDGYKYIATGTKDNLSTYLKTKCSNDKQKFKLMSLPEPLMRANQFRYVKALYATTSDSEDYIIEYWKYGPYNVTFVIKDDKLISLSYLNTGLISGGEIIRCNIDKLEYKADTSLLKVPTNYTENIDDLSE